MEGKIMPSIKIPDDCTLTQATAVFEFIDELKEAIIIGYQPEIEQQLRSEVSTVSK
ncbi:MAG: hypothetical protein ACI8WB_006070 [Phenylobacterium sp.]|jgi:hypothetical protein